MKQSYFAKYGRQLTCLLGLLGLAAPRAQAQTATAIYYTQGSSTAALDAVKSVAATGAGGATTLPAGATALSQPTDIVLDRASGYLYVADQYVGTGAIWRYNLNGTGQTRVVAPTAGVTYNGLALDAANGRLYFTQAGSTASQAALKVVSLGGALPATATTVAKLPTTFTRPGDLALDATAGVLYVADQRTAGSIVQVALGAGTVTTLVSGVADANYNGLALDAANGRLYFTQGSADATLDALKLVTLSNSAVTTLASGSTNFTQPTDLAFEPGAGQLYLTDQYVSTGPLLRYTVGVSNGTVSVSNRTALVSATTGAAYGGLALALTAAPVLATNTGTVMASEQVTTTIDPSITVTDPDSPTLTSATVSISSGLVSAEDALSFTANAATTGNIAGSYSAGTGVLTLTSAGGTATLAQWQAALRSVAYRNSSDAPTTAARTISFVVNDGNQNSNVATRTLSVQALNDAPVNTAPASINTPYNTDVAFTGANAISVSDVDAGTAFIQTSLIVTNGTLVRNGISTGAVSLTGSVSFINSSLALISFRPTSGFSGLATVTILTNDNGNTGAGGALTATSTINITVAAAPALTATVSTTSASPTSAASIPFSVTFSQSVGTTFTASDVTVSNGTVTSGSFSGSGAGPYTFTVTATGSGTVSVSLAASVASDANATANTASNTVSVQYNQPVTAAPVVTTPTNNSISNIRTVTVAGTAPDGSTVSIYISGNLAGTTQTLATGAFSFVVPGSALDGTYTASATAQSSGAAASLSSNVNTFTIDGTAPTVALSSATVTSGGTTSTTPVSFTATFSESVTGFTVAGLTVSNGTVTNGPTAGVNNTYTFQVTPSAAGTVTVRVAANAVQDRASNNNTASGTYTFMFAAPTITVAPASLASGGQGQTYSQTFSASGGSGSYTYALSGSIPSGLSFSGNTLSGTPTVSGSFTFRVTATDNSAAPGPYSGFSNYTLTIAPPAVTVAPVLTSPANNSTTSGTPTYAGTAPAGSTISIYVAAGSGAAQLVGTTTATGGSFGLVSPTALASGTYSAYATAQSSGATVSANSNTNTFTVDATAPVVVASNRQSPAAAATNATILTFRVTFSESVTGVDASNFALTTTTGTVSSSGRTVGAISGSVYDVTVSGVSGNGTVRLDLNASGTGIIDAVGNAIGGGYTSGQTYTIDQTAPTATISTTASSPTSISPIPFTVTFSETVTGFMTSSIVVTNGTVSSALATNGNAYSFSVTPAASGVVTVSVVANAAQDAVGNGNLAASPLGVTYVQPIPAPTITSLNPATGPVGTQVTIAGTNLSNATAVRFNGTLASSFVVNSATSITAVVAAGTTTGLVTVTTPGGTATSPYNFVVRVAPTTVADSYTTSAGVTLTGNVLMNDIGTNPRAILITRTSNGTLSLNPDGSFSYVPNPGFTGTDSFTYYACDPNLPLLCGNPATVTITVVRVAPITVADSYTTPAGVTLTGNVLTNDIGTNPRAILITRPANGTLALNPNGSFSYVPNPVFTGTDSFTYYACDPNMPLLCGNPATVTITVTGGGPITVVDTYSTPVNTLLTGNVLTNDIGTNLRAILINRPTRGTLALNPDGSFTYQPNAGYVGTDSFTYYACNMGSPLVCGNPATVTITIGAVATRVAATAPSGTSLLGGATVTQSAAALAREVVLTGSPNPFGEQLYLAFALPTTQPYTLAIYDAQGRLLQQLARGQAEAGHAQQVVVPTHTYAAGLYLVRLTTAIGTQQLKLIKQ